MQGVFLDWILRYVRDHAPELVLPVLKTVVLPFLKEKAAATGNKFDDYAVKQLERIIADPEFIALLGGIGS